ncbi:serine protease inhibitor ecotin [Yersinia ruckeri]|uniref:serine protease inhibitor ecotin n=1 Tax=Yersinia ruckeri TaxID=29486 RepID=UPI0011A8D3AA|nr:serine protease inhibitor ecotin [Yersinia ruckeri]EKN3346843.1 serine protease inhibitor ecotin [Yersinia ruckeri]EKN3362103.1 serine protease inhibitor ecotin [Yersinia ruckeri]EKN4201627.1 serine protease inhibitor ecotin [Yersinia ruckeri]EKN4208128.1 serine protease inhibitor ecotin [Yersinia ruckeri]EKN4697448.1 serine protease inhibitor ecotin [Yersinia ruckeri]
MNKISAMIASLLIATFTGAATADETMQQQEPLEKIAPFPAAESAMSRQVIYLPEKPDEDNFKVELLIGKTMMVDCNQHTLGGRLETRTLSGWGYTYFVMEKISGSASTLMGCEENSTKEKFVMANLGTDAMQRYNSRLPIVVYVPQGVEVKYRLWEASKEVRSAVEK